MKVLVTGAAGFIGHNVTIRLLSRGDFVVGVDNLNDYYDPSLKLARLDNIAKHANAANFCFIKLDLSDVESTARLFKLEKFDMVVNLAAQAGVRYSLENPNAYVQSNLVGFTNVLEGCRHNEIKHLVYASSSSVYGGNTKMPFSESDSVDRPVSLYAATKRANELMAYTYSHLYELPTTGLRFFTVYGPWGRPDMFPFLLADSILKGAEIQIFIQGDMMRDFTYIDDVAESLLRVLDKPDILKKDTKVPYRIFNIGKSQPEKLMDFIEIMEKLFGKVVNKQFLPMQSGDVKATYADVSAFQECYGYKPTISLTDGLSLFVEWYKMYYKEN